MLDLLGSPEWLAPIAAAFGLAVGSFLNVVIYRLPIMLERNWRRDANEFLKLPVESPNDLDAFDLSRPGSRCPQCGADVKPWHNIPVLSYVLLRGKCASCKAPIAVRYPCVELLTAAMTVTVALAFGPTPQALAAAVLTWSLIALSFIDIDHQLLPDSITIPMLWLGMAVNLFDLLTPSKSSVIGAIAGYLSLRLVYELFKIATGKEGMGFGDFKLLALIGAWLGWQTLPMVILLASVSGAVIGSLYLAAAGKGHSVPIPFGPYLALGGWCAMLWGDDLSAWYLSQL